VKTVDSFEFEVIEDPHVWITMSDGCRLSARIWRPSGAVKKHEIAPVPAIVEYLPYRKRDGTIARDQLTHPWFAGHGFACIRVDMRGNGDSEGLMSDEYTEQELTDACEVIDWVSQQQWCNGSLGMMGISWGGFNSLQVAAMRPPALKAIITLCSTVDRYADDIHYKGGCLLGENVGWAATMLSYSSRPPDPMLLGDQWRKLWLERLENMPFLASIWLRHQHRDDYWKRGSVCEDYSAIEAAVLSLGGWHDGYRNTISHLVMNLDAPVKGIVGPWIHKYPHYAAPQPAIGFLQEAKRWWDRWLKGIDTQVENDPAYRVWLMHSIAPARWLPERPGRWLGEQQWPSPNIQACNWTLAENDGAGLMLPVTDADKPENTFALMVPSDQSCGSAAGEYFAFAFGPELPDEQSADDKKSLVFESEPLSSRLQIVGAPSVQLELTANAAQGLICARLCEVLPDGQSALITYGLLNLAHHLSHEQPQPLIPNQRISATIVLDQIAFEVPVGHRLRLSFSSSYWPMVWPSPTGTTLTILSGYATMPVRDVDVNTPQPEVDFKPPEAATAWQVDCLRAASSTHDVSTDISSGVVTTTICNDFGENRDLEHGLVSGSSTKELWRIHPEDPLSASVSIDWQQTGGRDQWRWSTSVQLQMHADADSFYVSGKLTAYENEHPVFEREYRDVIKRQCV